MKILYVYPHPDDESFGPAGIMARQVREGHEVNLLTLTRGGATKQRFKYGYSVEEMGKVRYREMKDVKRALGLSGMVVLNLPDSGLKEMDPREIERVIQNEILSIKPHVIVTYAVHGISGFHDHLVTHAVVKRVYMDLKQDHAWLQRLAFITLTEEQAAQSRLFHLNGSKPEEIDCTMQAPEQDIRRNLAALDCYKTFQETIEKSGIRDFVKSPSYFEIFQEDHDPPLADLFTGIRELS